jgi:hypothetical protein
MGQIIKMKNKNTLSTNKQIVDNVARAICRAACEPLECPECINGICKIYYTFENEAIAALKVIERLKYEK